MLDRNKTALYHTWLVEWSRWDACLYACYMHTYILDIRTAVLYLNIYHDTYVLRTRRPNTQCVCVRAYIRTHVSVHTLHLLFHLSLCAGGLPNDPSTNKNIKQQAVCGVFTLHTIIVMKFCCVVVLWVSRGLPQTNEYDAVGGCWWQHQRTAGGTSNALL